MPVCLPAMAPRAALLTPFAFPSARGNAITAERIAYGLRASNVDLRMWDLSVTPAAVIEREVPGLGEAMRAKSLATTPTAMLSRATAGTLGRALQLLGERTPDAILLDIEMPRMDGFEFTKTMKADTKIAHIPIIMITSRTAEKHRSRARELGIEAYLGKPYQEEELLRNLRGVVALHAA